MQRLTDSVVMLIAATLFTAVYGIGFRTPKPPAPALVAPPEEVSSPDPLQDGLGKMRLKQYAAAEKKFRQAVEKGDSLQIALEKLAECQFYLHQDDECFATCDQIRKAYPYSSRASHIRGLLYQRQGNDTLATTEFIAAAMHGERTSKRQMSGATNERQMNDSDPKTPPAPTGPMPTGPVGPNLCHWLWSGTKWVADPAHPCECVDPETCSEPAEAGAYIDQEATTVCTS
jgi:hypothetical protein